MSRRVVLLPLVAIVLACVAVLTAAIWRQADSGPAIQTKALGVWEEQTEADPFRMTVSAAPEGSGETDYWVTYPRSFTTPFPARLDGDRILVWGENTQAVVWEITYDEGADALLVTRPATGERHILRRVSP
jgi:hypothetical protein